MSDKKAFSAQSLPCPRKMTEQQRWGQEWQKPGDKMPQAPTVITDASFYLNKFLPIRWMPLANF